jgi:hypothetical protein
MAFLNEGAPNTADDEIGPSVEYEFQWALFGFGWALQKRPTKLYRVYYDIDDTGGENPNATWAVGGVTYNLRSAGPELAYLDKRGLYLATYEWVGTWAWV